jgi:hypothetical protein
VITLQQLFDDIGTDETRAAGYQISHEVKAEVKVKMEITCLPF